MSKDSSRKTAEVFEKKILTIVSACIIAVFLVPVASNIAGQILGVGIALSGMSTSRVDVWIETSAAQLVYVLLADLIIISILLFFMNFFQETWKSIAVIWPKWRHVGYFAAGVFVYYATFLFVATIASSVLHLDFEQRQEIGFSTDVSGSSMAFAFAALVILPPVVEEALFRGFLYTRFKRALSVRWATIVVSVLFAVAHLQVGSGNALLWVAALDTFTLSLVLVYLREKTGTIWAGVGVHAFKNLVAFLILFKVLSV